MVERTVAGMTFKIERGLFWDKYYVKNLRVGKSEYIDALQLALINRIDEAVHILSVYVLSMDKQLQSMDRQLQVISSQDPLTRDPLYDKFGLGCLG